VALALKVNGEIRSLQDIAESDMLISVLTSLAVRKELVAIALNDTIVPRAKWNDTPVSEATSSKLCILLAAAV
jgi:thiamine biosynthesis protein ThiS